MECLAGKESLDFQESKTTCHYIVNLIFNHAAQWVALWKEFQDTLLQIFLDPRRLFSRAENRRPEGVLKLNLMAALLGI